MCAIETARRYGKENVILLNHDICPRVELPDIKRFKNEVADYLGIPITYANMEGWETKDQFDVCMEIGAFKYGIQSSALCTKKMKTEPFQKWLDENYPLPPDLLKGTLYEAAHPSEMENEDITVVYGFDANEAVRINRRVGIMSVMGYKTEYPLIRKERTIHNTEEAGIKRPVTYEEFNHANCIGCLKAGKQHWYLVYCLYPEVWEKAKQAEDSIGFSILRDGFLEEMEPKFKRMVTAAIVPTEKISPQRFWADVRKSLGVGKESLPCDCAV